MQQGPNVPALIAAAVR